MTIHSYKRGHWFGIEEQTSKSYKGVWTHYYIVMAPSLGYDFPCLFGPDNNSYEFRNWELL